MEKLDKAVNGVLKGSALLTLSIVMLQNAATYSEFYFLKRSELEAADETLWAFLLSIGALAVFASAAALVILGVLSVSLSALQFYDTEVDDQAENTTFFYAVLAAVIAVFAIAFLVYAELATLSKISAV